MSASAACNNSKFYLQLWLPVVIFCCFLCCRPDHTTSGEIKAGHVKEAQVLFGVEFSDTEIDTLLGTLEDCLAGYRAMRSDPLPHSVAPAFHFDPLPPGFIAPAGPDVFLPGELPVTNMPPDTHQIAFYSVPQLAYLLRSGQVTSRQLTKIYLDRIARFDDTLQAVITLTPDFAYACADQADRDFKNGIDNGMLQGIPYGMKDLASFPGYPTTWGAAPYRDQMLEDTAEVIRRLKAAGAVMIAKLSSGELANGDTWYGGRTRNPWDLSEGASGSSAGSGAATASGLVGFSIGTETWGSILSPSSTCGITGLRPTYGRVSRYGIMPLAWTLDKVGPMCRTAAGCAYVFQAIHGPDKKDRSTTRYAFSYDTRRDLGNIRAGHLDSLFNADSSSSGINGQAAIQRLATILESIETTALPGGLPWSRIMYNIIRSEASSVFDELILSNEDDLLARKGRYSRANSLRAGELIPAVAYIQANRYRSRLISQMDSLFTEYHVLFVPPEGSDHSAISNLTGHPAISIPTGFDEKGRPTSIIAIGRLYEEGTLLEIARKFQEMTSHHQLTPPGFE